VANISPILPQQKANNEAPPTTKVGYSSNFATTTKTTTSQTEKQKPMKIDELHTAWQKLIVRKH